MDYAHDGYLYIASPYTHDDPMIRQRRYEKALEFTAWLAQKYRLWGFSPIGHSHHMVINHDLPHTFEFWDDWNRCMIRTSIGIVVLQIKGWEESRGINAEMAYAKEIGKPIYLSQVMWGKVYDHST